MARKVLRNHRLQFAGVVALVLAAGLVVLAYVAAVSPGRSFDHPGGFTPGFRVLAVVTCVFAAAGLVVIAVGALRVSLVIDETGLVIRNSWRSRAVRWAAGPEFRLRDRRQTFARPGNTFGSTTYRYRAIECIADGRATTIAASSRMTHFDRLDDLLAELREASHKSLAQRDR